LGGGAPARPGRYVGAEEVEADGEPFEQKTKRLTATLEEQFTESAKLEKAIGNHLAALNLLRHERNESED
jgi:type I restriction enzyme M protein